MYRITKTFKWEMAHKLNKSYTKKCRNIHGHSYELEVTLKASRLREGVVEDFTFIKESLITPIVDRLDHSLLLYDKDPIVEHIKNNRDVFGKLLIYTLKDEPTAENIAGYIFYVMKSSIKSSFFRGSIILESVTVRETATSSATVTYAYPKYKAPNYLRVLFNFNRKALK